MSERPAAHRRGRLRLFTTTIPIMGLLVLYVLWLGLLRVLPRPFADIVIAALAVVGVAVFSWAVSDVIARQDSYLTRQYGELEQRYATERRLRGQLEALHEAALAITSAHTTEEILQRLVELARNLLGAQYAALGVLGPHGHIDTLYTEGMDAAERARIGPLPQGHGLLGQLLVEGASLRVDDISQDARFSGFPKGHPLMRSLLGVPVVTGGTVVGNLYLADKALEAGFSQEDERLLGLLAGHAAVVIQNARLTEQIRVLAIAAERERIRRDLHDGAIQAIYGVNLELERAEEDIEVDPAEARRRIDLAIDRLSAVMAEIRGYILGLGPDPSAADSLPEALASLLAETRAHTLLETDLKIEGLAKADMPPSVTQEMVQMAREAIANIVRHAHAGQIWATITTTAHEVHMKIGDNGKGFDLSHSVSAEQRGLRNLGERVHALGGILTVESAPGEGTLVAVRIPLGAVALEEANG